MIGVSVRASLSHVFALIAVVSPNALTSQTASEITPSDLAPPLQRLNGSVVFTGQTGTQAPPGSEQIGITLAGVDLENAAPDLAAQNAAYIERLTRGRIPVSELFEATADLEAAYADAGLILARVVLPQQSLRDGGRLRVVVVNGFIERIDLDEVPPQTRPRIERLTDGLVDRPDLTRRELERQLLLAGDTPGTALRSAIGAGEEEGGAVIALAPEYRPVTGSVGFGNPTSSELGGVSFNAGVEFNSPLRFGETFYARASGSPEQFFSGDPQSRVLAAGAVVPLGFTGLTLNLELTTSDTTPDSDATPTRSEFDRQSVRLSYPFVRSRNLNVTGLFALDFQQDEQRLLGSSAKIFEDKISVFRLGGSASIFNDNGAVTNLGLVLSQGVDAFGARSAADATASGTPLSRDGADSNFTKIVGNVTHQRSLSDRFALSVSGRFQTAFGDPLVISEQFTLVGPQELSSFDSGALRGDSGWVVRAELSTNASTEVVGLPVNLRPYAFVGFGEAFVEQPTATEEDRTSAWAYGLGMDIFTITESNFRASSVRIELGRGERDDGVSDETRLGITADFRF